MPLMESPTQLSHPEDFSSEEKRTERVRIKNRRKLYLDRHPEYFTSPDLELADPLLYDRCIRRFQSAAEREADGRSKGYSGVLEADLYRSEAKLAALKSGKNEDGISLLDVSASPSSSVAPGVTAHSVPFVPYIRRADGQVLPEEEDEVPKNKEEGFERWKFEMTIKFLKGEDQDFDYRTVDENEDSDVVEKREEEERWFDDEEPSWIEEDELDGVGETKGTSGETGIQDF